MLKIVEKRSETKEKQKFDEKPNEKENLTWRENRKYREDLKREDFCIEKDFLRRSFSKNNSKKQQKEIRSSFVRLLLRLFVEVRQHKSVRY